MNPELSPSQKLDILLKLSKEFNLKEVPNDPAVYTMSCGNGYTLFACVNRSWYFQFEDGITTETYDIESVKVPLTNAKDARKLSKKYKDECEKAVLELKGVNSESSEPETVETEVVNDLEEKKKILEALENGEIHKPESKSAQKHTPKQEPIRNENSTPRVSRAITIPSNVSAKQVMELTQQDIINYICPDANPQEAMMFLKLCQARDINPFLKEAYLIKYKPSEPASMVVARDYFTRKADEYPQYDGYEAGIIIKKEDGSFERREGTFMVPPEELVGGWCKVYRKDRSNPHVVEVTLKEYQQRKSDGSLNRFWNDKTGKPATMIRKVAVSQCHREAFPGKFSGMYDSSEIAGGMEALEESIIEAVYQEVEA